MAELQWMLIRDSSCHLVKRSNIAFSSEPGNLAGLHSFKYSVLAQPQVVSICAVPEGVSISRRSTKVPTGKVSKSMVKPSIIKKNAAGVNRLGKVSRDMESTGYRLDLIRAAQAKVCAVLASHKNRKNVAKKFRANKLAKLGRK